MQEQRAPSIVAIATKYGLVQGVLSFVVFLAVTLTGLRQNLSASLINVCLLIVFMVLAHQAIKKSRDGMMTYGQGLGSGTWLASIGSLASAILVYIYVKYINTGYIAAAMKAQKDAMAQRGMTEAQAQQAMAITSAMMSPVGIVLTSLIVGVIGGLIVALIVSIFTQKADPRAVI